tara:strand:- start:5425 stop:6195 length:771 start_codon:yes stop_codon:yes gene_type:complete
MDNIDNADNVDNVDNVDNIDNEIIKSEMIDADKYAEAVFVVENEEKLKQKEANRQKNINEALRKASERIAVEKKKKREERKKKRKGRRFLEPIKRNTNSILPPPRPKKINIPKKTTIVSNEKSHIKQPNTPMTPMTPLYIPPKNFQHYQKEYNNKSSIKITKNISSSDMLKKYKLWKIKNGKQVSNYENKMNYGNNDVKKPKANTSLFSFSKNMVKSENNFKDTMNIISDNKIKRRQRLEKEKSSNKKNIKSFFNF